jgi:RimJ/RimL family protein N-acetyltransferase
MELDSPELVGSFVQLTPVDRACLPELSAAALSSPAIWQHIPYRMASPADIAGVLEGWIAGRAAGRSLSFVTRWRETAEIIGGSSVFVIDRTLPSVEIGFTWIVPRWQRSCVNTEAKLLQLSHCFDVWGCERVEFKTDIRNLRSRAALARIGATEEGVLRAQRRRLDGSLRDSVLFSIVASEWPGVREQLIRKLERPGALNSA